MLYEHYMTYGDAEFIKRLYPKAHELLSFCETRINKDGFIEGKEKDWTFIDWARIEKHGAVCAEQMLLIKAYSSMAAMAIVLGNSESDLLTEKSERLKCLVNE